MICINPTFKNLSWIYWLPCMVGISKGLRTENRTRQATHVQRNTEARSHNHGCNGNNTYSGWVLVALGMQHTVRMRRIRLSSVASLAVQYFSTLSHERYNCRGEEKKRFFEPKSVLIFSTTYICNISHSKKKWARNSQFIKINPTRCNNANKGPTRCNSMQTFIHCHVILHVSGVTHPSSGVL